MKKYILIIAVFFTAGISGCKKDYLSLEVNPNSPSVTTPQLTLAGALKIAVDITNQSYSEYGVWIGYWTPSGNYVPNSSLQQFQITNTSYTGVWTSLYQNITNFNNLQATATADPTLSSYQAIAMIMKVYDFQQLVDQFGDVPYSQAFQPSTILFPAYDKGQDIYNDLVTQLQAAIDLTGKGGANPGSADIVFAGDMNKWKQFANTLMLRLAIRQSNLATNKAKDAVASLTSNDFLTASATAQPGYSNTLSNNQSQQSPFWAAYGADVTGNATFNNVYYRGNNFFINYLTNTHDPRINAVYAPTDDGGAIGGNTFGDTKTTQSNPATSAIGPGLLISPTQPAVLFSLSESDFLQAEAAQRGWIGGDAQALYQAGITASFTALGLTAGQAATYYNQPIVNVGWAASAASVSPTNPEPEIKAIIYQKWISQIGYNNLQPYLDYLRTGYPVLPNPISIDPARVSDVIPVRQYYPLSELTSNGTNLAKEGTIDIFTTKIFWAK